MLVAQRRLRIGDRHLADQVLAVALEQRMLAHVDEAVAIAGRAAVRARLAFAAETQVGAGRRRRREYRPCG